MGAFTSGIAIRSTNSVHSVRHNVNCARKFTVYYVHGVLIHVLSVVVVVGPIVRRHDTFSVYVLFFFVLAILKCHNTHLNTYDKLKQNASDCAS